MMFVRKRVQKLAEKLYETIKKKVVCLLMIFLSCSEIFLLCSDVLLFFVLIFVFLSLLVLDL